MSFVKWIIDSLVSEDVIDLYFVISELKDIPISDQERVESNALDSECLNKIGRSSKDKRPIGKRVE